MLEGPYCVMDDRTCVWFGPLDGAFKAFNDARRAAGTFGPDAAKRVRLYECTFVLDGSEAKDPVT